MAPQAKHTIGASVPHSKVHPTTQLNDEPAGTLRSTELFINFFIITLNRG